MRDPDWESMDEQEFEALLEGSVTQPPPEQVVAEVTLAAGHQAHPHRHRPHLHYPEFLLAQLPSPRHWHGADAAGLPGPAAGKPVAGPLLRHHGVPCRLSVCRPDPQQYHLVQPGIFLPRGLWIVRAQSGPYVRAASLPVGRVPGSPAKGGAASPRRFRRGSADLVWDHRPAGGLEIQRAYPAPCDAGLLYSHPSQPVEAVQGAGSGGLRHPPLAGAH